MVEQDNAATKRIRLVATLVSSLSIFCNVILRYLK